MTIFKTLMGRGYTYRTAFGEHTGKKEREAFEKKYSAKCAECKRARRDHLVADHQFKEGGK